MGTLGSVRGGAGVNSALGVGSSWVCRGGATTADWGLTSGQASTIATIPIEAPSNSPARRWGDVRRRGAAGAASRRRGR